MITKYIVLALSAFLNMTNDLSQLRQEIRKEFSWMVFRLLAGVFFISIVIFSVIQLAKIYQLWLKQFENALAMETLSFACISVLGFFMICLLFLDRPVKIKLKEESELKNQDKQGLDLQGMAVKFSEGFFEGLERR